MLEFSEATIGFEPMIRVLQTRALPLGYVAIFNFNDSNGNRTRVTAVKGRCLNRLTMGPHFFSTLSCFLAPRVGLEPTTPRLTAVCSTIELSRNISSLLYLQNRILLNLFYLLSILPIPSG